jgi:hypothetical protein
VNYESPLELIFSQIEEVAKERARALDNMVWDSVMKCGVNVDKEELIKALAYDRGQYEKGYLAGRWDRDAEIVRCRVCKHRPTDPENKGLGQSLVFPDDVCPCQIGDNWYSWMPKDDWFCGDGEKEEEEDG